jgi:8-oxo-dGTP pyrophosphatase MutT (NUDIX family)
MKKYSFVEIKEKDGNKVTYIWHPGIIPENVPIQQVYGFCLTTDNLVVLVKEKNDNRFTPPGGGVEKGETALETLLREFVEEVQFIPSEIKLLGSLEVINPAAEDDIQKHNLQVRFVCKVNNLKEFIPLVESEIEERISIHYKDLPQYVGFIDKYASGKIQYDMLCDYIEGRIILEEVVFKLR